MKKRPGEKQASERERKRQRARGKAQVLTSGMGRSRSILGFRRISEFGSPIVARTPRSPKWPTLSPSPSSETTQGPRGVTWAFPTKTSSRPCEQIFVGRAALRQAGQGRAESSCCFKSSVWGCAGPGPICWRLQNRWRMSRSLGKLNKGQSNGRERLITRRDIILYVWAICNHSFS